MTPTLIALALAPAFYLDGNAAIPPGFDSLLNPQMAECVAAKVGPGMAQTFIFDPSTAIPLTEVPKKTLEFSAGWAKKVMKGLGSEQIQRAGWQAYRGKDPRSEMMKATWQLDDATVTWLDTIYGTSLKITRGSKTVLTSESDFAEYIENELDKVTNLPKMGTVDKAVVGLENVGSQENPVWLAKSILFRPRPDKNGHPMRGKPAVWDNEIMVLADGQTTWVRINLWTESTWKSPTPPVAYAGGPFKSRFDP